MRREASREKLRSSPIKSNHRSSRLKIGINMNEIVEKCQREQNSPLNNKRI